jgi:transcriptional regulator NrdR family protein
VFSTLEQPILSQTWSVKYPSGKITEFTREKLFLSIYESLKHRQSSIQDAKNLADTVIIRLRPIAKTGIIDSRVIRDVVIVSLSRFDKAASTHYDSFH